MSLPSIIAVRHGMPEDHSYLFDPSMDPGLAQTPENTDKIQAAGLKIATYFDGDPKVAIATSPALRACETGEALKNQPAIEPFIIGDLLVSHELSEEALSNCSEYDRSLALLGTLLGLAATAFKGVNEGKPHLILVTHDSVVGHLAKMRRKTANTDYLEVTPLD